MAAVFGAKQRDFSFPHVLSRSAARSPSSPNANLRNPTKKQIKLWFITRQVAGSWHLPLGHARWQAGMRGSLVVLCMPHSRCQVAGMNEGVKVNKHERFVVILEAKGNKDHWLMDLLALFCWKTRIFFFPLLIILFLKKFFLFSATFYPVMALVNYTVLKLKPK